MRGVAGPRGVLPGRIGHDDAERPIGQRRWLGGDRLGLLECLQTAVGAIDAPVRSIVSFSRPNCSGAAAAASQTALAFS
jgi:hypothetical protein